MNYNLVQLGMRARTWSNLIRGLELDLSVPLGAGGVLPVALRVQQQDRFPPSLRAKFKQLLMSDHDDPDVDVHLLGGLASVEVEVDQRGDEAGGDEEQQRLQQAVLKQLKQKKEGTM